MKKLFIILLVLAVAGGAFAQDLTWSGQLQTGVWFQGGDFPSGTPAVKADDDDSGHGVEAKITALYDAGDWGLKFTPRVVADAVPDINDPMSKAIDANLFADNAYGWINFLDKMINVKTGFINDAVWGNAGQFGENYDAGLGVRLEVMPIDGLNVGAFFNYPDGGSTAGKTKNFFGETAFGFKYTADVWNLSATLKLYSEESTYSVDTYQTDPLTGDYILDADGNKIPATYKPDMKALFGFGFTGVQNLTVIVDGHFLNMSSWSDQGKFECWEEFGYQLSNPFTVGLNLFEAMSGDSDVGFYNFGVWPYAYYMVTDSVQVGLDVKLFLGKNNWDGTYDDGSGNVNSMGLNQLNPDIFVKYTMGNAWVQGTYVVDYWMKDYTANTAVLGTTAKSGDAAFNQWLKVVFGYTF